MNPFLRTFEPIVEESEPIGQKFLHPFWNCIKIGYLTHKKGNLIRGFLFCFVVDSRANMQIIAGSREKYGIHSPGFFTKSVPYFDALPQGADSCRPHFFAHATVARTSYLYAGSREKYGIHRPRFFTKSVPYFAALPQGADTCRPHHDWTVILIQGKYQNYRLFYIKTAKSRALNGKYRQNPAF